MAGPQYCRITPEGNVTPCPYMPVVAGNIREKSFREIWESSSVLQPLRDLDQLKGRCGRCGFKSLCGGCRCRAYAAFGDFLEEDPACTFQPTGRPLQVQPIAWSAEARARLERIPIAFIRDKVRQGLESYAQRQGLTLITPAMMKEATAGMARPAVIRHES